jgi:hypothetical protein
MVLRHDFSCCQLVIIHLITYQRLSKHWWYAQTYLVLVLLLYRSFSCNDLSLNRTVKRRRKAESEEKREISFT